MYCGSDGSYDAIGGAQDHDEAVLEQWRGVVVFEAVWKRLGGGGTSQASVGGRIMSFFFYPVCIHESHEKKTVKPIINNRLALNGVNGDGVFYLCFFVSGG